MTYIGPKDQSKLHNHGKQWLTSDTAYVQEAFGTLPIQEISRNVGRRCTSVLLLLKTFRLVRMEVDRYCLTDKGYRLMQNGTKAAQADWTEFKGEPVQEAEKFIALELEDGQQAVSEDGHNWTYLPHPQEGQPQRDHFTKPFSEQVDDLLAKLGSFHDQINSMENIMQFKTLKIESQTLINGTPADKFSDDQLISLLEEQKAQLASLKAMTEEGPTSKLVTEKLAATEKQITALIAYMDTRAK